MPRSRRAIASLAIGLGAAIGCAKLVGADFTDPPRADDGDSGPCAVSRSGVGRLRLGDFVPTLERHDFCVTGGALTSALDAAPQGIGYEEVLAPIGLPRGSYRVDVVLAGQGCDAVPLVTTGVCLDGGSAMTVLLLGDGAGALQLNRFPESSAPTRRAPLRFVNAIANDGAFDLGHIASASLPADVTPPPLFASVQYGTTGGLGTSSDGTIDGNGYVALTPPPTELPLGAAPAADAGQEAATLFTSPLLVGGHRYTVVATGSSADVRFPEELFVCDETQTDGALTACGGFATQVTIDTFNPFLFGPFAYQDKLRHDQALAAIPKLTSDIVCVPGVYLDDDKKTVVANAATKRFPYSYWVTDSFDTTVGDPADQHGGTPPAPVDPPCTSAQSGLSALLQCIEASTCASTPNDPNATVAEDSLACLTQSCGPQVVQLSSAAPACWLCVSAGLQSYASFAATETACSTNAKAGLGWGGASGVLLLSRFPLKDLSEWVLPSTFQRASLLEASMAIQNAELDVYCGILETPGDGTDLPFPYTGPYGNGAPSDAEAWRQELLLQTQKVVAEVSSRSGARGRRAVVAGQWNTGPTEQQGGSADAVLPPYNPESYAVLSLAFPQAAPPGYSPTCTFCWSNPLVTPRGQTPTASNAWGTYAMLSGIPVTDVASASVILTAPVIPYLTGKVPISPIYGYRATVSVRPR